MVWNSTLKKTILSRIWKNVAFPFDQGIFFRLFPFLFVVSSLVCVVISSTIWTFTSGVKTLPFSRLSVSSISSGAMNSVSESFIDSSILSSSSLYTVYNNVNIWSVEIPLSIWKYLFGLLFIFQLFTHKLFTITLQQTFLMDQNHKMFVRIQKLRFSNYVNTNVIQGLVNIEKPLCPIF